MEVTLSIRRPEQHQNWTTSIPNTPSKRHKPDTAYKNSKTLGAEKNISDSIQDKIKAQTKYIVIFY